jgi:hypothetical protein
MENKIEENGVYKPVYNKVVVDAYDLEKNSENFDFLMERMERMDLYNDYTRIIFFYRKFLSPGLKERIIANGQKVFGLDTTKNWI